ncbi:MAG: rRNA pseudouridine synthase [Gemmatimonadetes bacterium]|nr:rRNA pseudouridine synthase [Gemmatimonadota bacterium]MBK6778855.1 rRNA pseudouridine synthase [Gemmatimonadota bacterium]MBK7348834.1 rRNA pseudouridine synthase [Gemmatimonadota bacterium]MBK7783464.1 rRNA pseudouridine synthase [Gemmatimonadota bacterium]MBK7924403.1 rRNA pseudouridine synthase [Gemmatimonadota bacterium]
MSEMRLQRALARAGIASRRAAEELIETGKVRVDGAVATLGMKVDPDRQKITVGGKAIPRLERRWLAFHKPMGVVTTASDEEGRRTVFDFVKDPRGLTYVGRLDVNTTGLLLLTTDGEAVHRLTHPSSRIPRSYTALVHGLDLAAIEAAIKRRVAVDGKPVVPTAVRVRPGRDGRAILDVTLTEGRNRIVRRWCEEMGLKVERLARLAYGPIRLGELAVGQTRPLTPAEEDKIYAILGRAADARAKAATPAKPARPRGRPAPRAPGEARHTPRRRG